MPSFETFLYGGFVGALPLWEYSLYGYIRMQILMMVISVYLHRTMAHGSMEMHPGLKNYCRFEFWLAQTSRVVEWVAVHLMHHAWVDTEKDPHSPWYHNLWMMVFATAYRRAAKNPEIIARYGKGVPDDWLEKNIFTKHRKLGIVVHAVILVSLFGVVPGAILWTIHVGLSPLFASFGVNGLAHRYGYKNRDYKKRGNSKSRNLIPVDPFTCGELLHDNHHYRPDWAKLSHRWYEFDPGWAWITLYRILGLVWNVRTHRRPASLT